MSDLPTFRVGVVGLGNIGRFHADYLRELGQDVVGGVDVSETARDEFAHEYGAATFDEFEGLYDYGIDALVVTTPNKFHEEYAVAALERDVPVLVEKPLAHTVESAERVAAAAHASAAFCMVGFHKRFLGGASALRGRLRRGELGELYHVEANYVRRRGIPGRGGWFTRNAVSGGGALLDIGTHALDLALHFLDFAPVRTVDATILSEFGTREDYTYLEMWGPDEGPDRYDVEDSVRAFLRTEQGTSIALNAAWAANEPDDTTISLTGSDGGACLDHETGELELYAAANSGDPQLLTTAVRTRNDDPHREEQRLFLEGVETGVPPETNTIDEALVVQELVEAIYRAGETGDRVRLDDLASAGLPQR